MTESSYFWDGASTGDATPMTDDLLNMLFRILFQKTPDSESVLKGIGSELEVLEASDGSSQLMVQVLPGSALVHGTYYELTEAMTINVEKPASGTHYYFVLLLKDWTSQTVRIEVLGPQTSATPPGLDQADGVVWETRLATVSVTSAGVVGVSDVRDYCTFRSAIA